jgi:hypothetical protein
MTSGQRKAHKVIWILIGITLPILIFFSMRGLDFSDKKEQTPTEQTKNTTYSTSAENDLIKVNSSANSIQVILKSSLKTSSSVVYSINENGEKGKALGQVSTVGIYDFTIKEKIKGIVIFDKIKEVEITKLTF